MSTIEKKVIELLSAANYSDTLGPSYTFQRDITTDELLSMRTPEMVNFLTTAAEKYTTPGGWILDVACGSGNDSAMLVSKGYKVVSFDLSEGMVGLAQRNKLKFLEQGCKEFNNWEICQGDMSKAKEVITSRPDLPQEFDAVICLGNSIPLLLSQSAIADAFTSFSQLLRKGGALLVDHRNYLPALSRGKLNRNGFSPVNMDKYNGLLDIDVSLVYEPGVPPVPVIAFIEYQQRNGERVYMSQRFLTPEAVTDIARAAMGESAIVNLYLDLQPEDQMAIKDACWITYIIEKDC